MVNEIPSAALHLEVSFGVVQAGRRGGGGGGGRSRERYLREKKERDREYENKSYLYQETVSESSKTSITSSLHFR